MKQFKKLVIPYVIWATAIIIIPIFLIFLYSITTGGNPLVNISFTLGNFEKIFEPIYFAVFIRSLKIGLITVGLCLLLGYPLAYAISKFDEKTQSILILFVTIPMWINMLLRTYAWMSILSDNGIINSFLRNMGFDGLNLMYTDFAVILGLVCDLMPFMVIPIHTSMAKMDKTLIEAAYDLGADKITTFIKVELKLTMPGVINGVIMTFLLAISSFVIPKFLGGGQYVLIGNLIENQFISVGDWNFGSAISILLAIVILIAIRCMKKMDVSEQEEE